MFTLLKQECIIFLLIVLEMVVYYHTDTDINADRQDKTSSSFPLKYQLCPFVTGALLACVKGENPEILVL